MKVATALLLVGLSAVCDSNPLPNYGGGGSSYGQLSAGVSRSGGSTFASVAGSNTWNFDRGSAAVSGSHQRELGGDFRTSAGVSGSYDVYNDGNTRGTVFGSLHRNWDSTGPGSKGYEYGGRIEHTWGD